MAISSPIRITAKIAGRELLGSGVVHLGCEDPVVIEIDALKFVFSFKSDDAGSRYTGTIKDNALHFDLFNHKNALGEGMLTPIEVGTLNGRALSFTYFVNTIDEGKNARRFEYTFYLGETK